MSDYIEKILKLQYKLQKDGLSITEKGLNDLYNLHDMIMEYLLKIQQAVETSNGNILTEATSFGKKMKYLLLKV